MRAVQTCTSRSITTKALRTLILDTIRTVSTYAIENEEAFIEKIRDASQIQQEEAAKEQKRKVAKAKKRFSELDILIKKLYESYATGKIPERRFDMLSTEYEKEQADLEQFIEEGQKELEQYHTDTDRVEQFLQLTKKYRDFSELTTPMLNEFVEKVMVHAPEKIDGERCQEIDIYLNFIGNFKVPMPEPTPEELAEMEKQKKQRAANRRKYERRKERKRQEQMKAEQEKTA